MQRAAWFALAICACTPEQSLAGGEAQYCATAQSANRPTRLGAASNFSQGWNAQTFDAARRLPLHRLRDSLRWDRIEREPGRYVFDKDTTLYPDRAAKAGMAITLTLNWGNPLYDRGDTPHSDEALAAFGRFAAAVVQRFPAIDTLEIGNEVNGANFVSGPVKDAGLAQRATYHLAMVRAAQSAVHRVRPDVTVLGGATHSLPGGYLGTLVAADASRAVQGLAVHPYTTPIDQLPATLEWLCSAPGMAQRPLYITEFASPSPARASHDLVRAYATLAALHAAEFDWYPFNPRGEKHMALITRDGAPTRTGQAFRFVQDHLAPFPARDASPDALTTTIAFGPRAWVVWGAKRALRLTRPDLRVYDASGTNLSPEGLELDEEKPLILLSEQPVATFPAKLGCTSLVADSRLQFRFPSDSPVPSQAPDPFERFALFEAKRLPLVVLPGQQRAGVPWNPYLGLARFTGVQLDGANLRTGFGRRSGTLVIQTPLPSQRALRVVITIEPKGTATSGGQVQLKLGPDLLEERAISAPLRFERTVRTKDAQPLSVALSGSAGQPALAVRYRIQVFDESRCTAGPASTKRR